MTAPTDEFDLDDNQVVDVLEVVADHSCRVSRIATADHEVASGTCGKLASHMPRQDELAIAPPDVHLCFISTAIQSSQEVTTGMLTRLCLMYRSCRRT